MVVLSSPSAATRWCGATTSTGSVAWGDPNSAWPTCEPVTGACILAC